jgi:hypothetical protein
MDKSAAATVPWLTIIPLTELTQYVMVILWKSRPMVLRSKRDYLEAISYHQFPLCSGWQKRQDPYS